MTIDKHRQAIRQAADKLRQGRLSLLDANGNRIYSDAEHTRREDELRAEYERAMREAGEAASRVALEADAEANRAYGDPITTLSATDRQAAATLSPFVEADYADLPLADLVGQAEAAVRDGDRPTRYLHWRFAGRRLREMQEIRRDEASGRWHSVSQDPTTRRLVITLSNIHERLERSLVDVDARERARADAVSRRDEALDVAVEVGTRRVLDRRYGTPPSRLRVTSRRQR